MAQPAYNWLREPQPESPSLSDDPFGDIPIAGTPTTTPPQPLPTTPAANEDPFADIPITPMQSQGQQGAFSKYWEQAKAGAGELASAVRFDQARRQAEQLKQLEQPGMGYRQGGGILGGSIIPEQAKAGKQEYVEERMGEALTSAEQYRNYAANIPQVDSVRKFLSGESGQSWWDDLKDDPVEIILGLGSRSAAGSTVALGAGMLGGLATGSPVGAMAGAGAASGRMEYMHGIMQGMEEQGIQWTDPEAFREAINNPQIMEPIKEQALKRGLIIGAFDGVAALMGGKIIAPKAMIAKSAGKAQLVNLPAQTGIQGLLGGGGEATAQYTTTGDFNTREVMAEALGELVLAPVEFAGTYYSIAKGSKGVAADRLKATNELIDILLQKRQRAYSTGSAADIQQVSEELNQYMGLRDQLQEKVGQSDTETLLESERTITQAMDVSHQKLLNTPIESEERSKISDQMVKLNARREQVQEMLTSQPRTITGEQPAMSREDALKELEVERQQRRDKTRQEEEELYRQKQNPMAAAGEAEQKAAQEGADALSQQLAASGAYGNARSINEMADETTDREMQQQLEDELTQLMELIPTATGARRIVLTKRFNDLTTGLLKRPTSQQPIPAESEPEAAQEPYRSLPDILRKGQERIQERQQQAQNAEQDRTRQETEQTIIDLEKHLMEIQSQQDQESQRQADWDRAEIQRLQQELQAQTPTNPAMTQAMRQAEISAAEQQAESQRKVERWNQYSLAERQRYAHELIDEAVRTGQIGLLGEPIARAYAERGDIPPNLESVVSQAQGREIEQGFQSEMGKRTENIRQGEEINRLEGHIQQQEQVDQAKQSWTAAQAQPGAIQQQQPVSLTGLLKSEAQPQKQDKPPQPETKTEDKNTVSRVTAPTQKQQTISQKVDQIIKDNQIHGWEQSYNKASYIAAALHEENLIPEEFDEYLQTQIGNNDTFPNLLQELIKHLKNPDYPLSTVQDTETTKPTEQPTQVLGLSNESGTHLGEPYKRTVDMGKVAPSVKNVARLFVEMEPGDLLITPQGAKWVVTEVRGGKIYSKEDPEHGEMSTHVNVFVHKDNKRKPTEEIRQLTQGNNTPTPTPKAKPKLSAKDQATNKEYNRLRNLPGGKEPGSAAAKFGMAASKAKFGSNKPKTANPLMKGFKSKSMSEGSVFESLKKARKNVGASTCWDGYTAKGTKKKGGKDVPNCVKEEEIVEGIRDKDSEKGTKERKARLEKKRGMKVDDHPEYLETNMKKRQENNEKARKDMDKVKGQKNPHFEDVSHYDVILAFLSENNLIESVEEAEEIMMQLTGAQIVEIIDEFMNDSSVVEQKATAVDGHGNTYRDYNNDGLSARQQRMKKFGDKRAAMLAKGV